MLLYSNNDINCENFKLLHSMANHWRYATIAPDYEDVQRELRAMPFLRMREDETYYAFIRRMDLLVERATELRESAQSTWFRGRAYRDVRDPRDLPSTSTRPAVPIAPPVSPHLLPVFSPRPFHFPDYSSPRPMSSPRAETLPRFEDSPDQIPRMDIRQRPLGLVARGPPVIPRDSAGFELSPSRQEFTTWGYTDIASSSEDEREPSWATIGSGYRVGGCEEHLRGGVETERVFGGGGDVLPRVGGVIEARVGVAEVGEGSAAVAESAASTSELIAWVPESPVVEVVVISSAEGAAEGEPVLEDDEMPGEDSEMTDTITTADSLDDPDYTVGS